MLTDEQLIADVRRELHRELAPVEPPPGVVEFAWRQPQSFVTRRWQRLALLVATAVPVAGVLLAIVLLGHNGSRHPAPARPPTAGTPTGARVSPAVKAAVRPLSSILGVLRRPQTTADRDPALIREIRREQHDTFGLAHWGRPVAALARFATVAPWGQRIYVVPSLAPTRAERRRAPRKDTLSRSSTVSLWVWAVSGDTVTDFFGGPAASPFIEGGRDYGNGAYDFKAYDHPRQWIMVVPDGVTKVALWKAISTIDHPHPSTVPGSRPVIATVHDNIAAFVAPPSLAGPVDTTRFGQEIWYGPGGTIVKRIDNAGSCGPPLGGCG